MAHILVLDDEQAITAVMRQILEQAGHQVLLAPNGKVAMKLCDAHPVDLVITDIWMPEQDGLETIIQLRRWSTAPKILAMSGGGRYGLIEFLKMAQQLGADRTLCKPFSQQDLLDAVHGLLED